MQHKFLIRVSSYIRRYKDTLAILFFALLVGFFFYRTILTGKLPVPSDALVGLYHPYRDAYAALYPNGIPFKNFLITDPVRQQIPWRKTAIDDIRVGKLPVWNATAFSGTPLLANIQSGALYPLNIIFFIFPFDIAWSILVMTQPFLAGLFLYWFLRNKKLGVQASILGAICFAFSGFSIAWLTWGTMLATWLWTPLSLFALDKIHNNRKWYWGLLLGFSIVSSFFAGHLQLFIYSMVLIVAYALWSTRTVKRQPWLLYITIITGAVLLTAPQWIEMLKWLPQTSRVLQGASWQKEGFFIPIWHLVQFVAPDYFGNPATLNYWGVWNYGEMVGYVGIAGLILAALGISTQTLFWFIVVLVAVVFAVASPVSFLPYQLHIPFVSLLQPTRLVAVIDFGLAILAAYGFSEVVKGKRGKRLIYVSVSLLGTILFLWGSALLLHFFGVSPEHALVSKRNIIIPIVLIIGLFFLLVPLIVIKHGQIRKQYVSVIGVILMIFFVFDLFRFGWKFTPFTDSAYFFPQTKILTFLQKQNKPYRIMATDDSILPPNVNEYYGIESVEGYDPIHASRYEEFIAAMERGAPNIQPPFGLDRIMAPKNVNSPLFELLNVRYVLSFEDLENDGFRKVSQEGKTMVFENTHVLPRVYLAQEVMFKNSKQNVMNALYDSAFKPGITAITEFPIGVLNVPLSLSEAAAIQSYKENEILVKVTVSNSRLLVIGNMFNNGWYALIDNKPSVLYRVNYIFMGILVPSGSHIVTLTYR